MAYTSAPAKYAVGVTPDVYLPATSRALYIGVSGNLSVKMSGDGSDVIFPNVPVGILPVEVTRVNSAGTTASGIVSMWG